MKLKAMIAQVEARSASADLSISASDISVQRLIDDSLLILSREIRNLLGSSVKGKLGPNEARDLRDHLKLLFELRDREKESLKGLTDEQLQKILKEIQAANGDKQVSGNGGGSEPPPNEGVS